jgi:hypothetical protein
MRENKREKYEEEIWNHNQILTASNLTAIARELFNVLKFTVIDLLVITTPEYFIVEACVL